MNNSCVTLFLPFIKCNHSNTTHSPEVLCIIMKTCLILRFQNMFHFSNMKRILIAVSFICAAQACEPREIDTINIRQVWKVMSVKENGLVTFDAANVEGSVRVYSRFTIDLTDVNAVNMTTKNDVRHSGNWTLSRDYKKLLFNNMVNTATSQTTESYEFDIVSSQDNILLLKGSASGSTSGKVHSEYTLIHN